MPNSYLKVPSIVKKYNINIRIIPGSDSPSCHCYTYAVTQFRFELDLEFEEFPAVNLVPPLV